MSVLRVRCGLSASDSECEWALIDGDVSDRGVGPVSMTGKVKRIELVIPAADVLITRTRLPPTARRRSGATLAYAVEEHTLGEPEAQHVTWLGKVSDDDVLAVVDRAALEGRIAALHAQHDAPVAVYCESLLLPFTEDEWSVAWDGSEGFVRTGPMEAAAMDAGDAHTPPLSLQLMLEDADARGVSPSGVAIYLHSGDAAPDLGAWHEKLGVPLRLAGVWDSLTCVIDDRARIADEAAPRRQLARVASRLRVAAWLAGTALVVHALALAVDWALLASEERNLRAQMETRFRAVFPEAVAVVNPALQMRRKLADLRHAANRSDESDFLPLIAHVAGALADAPPGVVRLVVYDRGRLTVQLAEREEARVQRLASRLQALGYRVDVAPAAARTGERSLVISVAGA